MAHTFRNREVGRAVLQRELSIVILQIFIVAIVVIGGSEYLVQAADRHREKHGNTEGKQIDIPERQTYVIEEFDVLDITVFEEPDLSLKLKVAQNGTISFPLIGEVKVTGLTAYEVQNKLEKLLIDGEFLIEPRVSARLDIELMQLYKEKEVFVMGEVQKKGPITILGKYISVLEAITKAGGFTEYAAPNRTSVIRIEDGNEKTIQVDLNKVRKGDKSLDIMLKAGDVVVVPEAHF